MIFFFHFKYFHFSIECQSEVSKVRKKQQEIVFHTFNKKNCKFTPTDKFPKIKYKKKLKLPDKWFDQKIQIGNKN